MSTLQLHILLMTIRGLWRAFLPVARSISDLAIWLTLFIRLTLKRMFRTRSDVFPGLAPSHLHVVVINLTRREDRRALVLENLSKVGFENVTVLQAVDGPQKYPDLVRGNAANLGCAESHIMAIERHLSKGTPIAVCEDDNQFTGKSDEVMKYISSFLDSPEADVLCLVARNRGPRVAVNSEFAMAGWAVAPSFYVVKPNAKRDLVRALSKSVRKLTQQKRRGPFDQVWRWTQRFRLVFFLPQGKVGRQRESFSDIQGQFFHGT